LNRVRSDRDLLGRGDRSFESNRFFEPAGQVLAVVFFLIPGLNVTWIVERLRGRSTLASTERLLRAIAWSVLIYALASPWLLRIGRRLAAGRHLWPWEPIIGAALIIFVAPVALATLIAALRQPGRILIDRAEVETVELLSPRTESGASHGQGT
jgi:hypothetical protein